MQQCEIHAFASYPGGSGWLFYDSGVLNGKKVENHPWFKPRMGNLFAITGRMNCGIIHGRKN